MDYPVPRASTVPTFHLEHVEEPAANLVGVRGVGEGGTLGPSAALANAVADALAPWGVEPDTLPLTPARLWTALRAADGPREA
jgi:carbon-monoxide dehydrogenase large subunit